MAISSNFLTDIENNVVQFYKGVVPISS